MDLTAIKQIAFAEMGDKRSHPFKERGNKYTHGERVAKLAVRLRQLLFPENSELDDILTIAAWFHDICNGVDNHTELGAERTRELLTPYCTAEELEQICAIIAVHDDRKMVKTYPDIIKLHQDADHLDHFGTFDVWICFQYAPPHDQTIDDAREWMRNVRQTENKQYRSELNFELSRRIFDEKAEFLQAFTERFAIESTGGIWNEELLI